MADRETPGSKLSARLLARADQGLHRKSAPDGGEVVSGPLARQALRSIGARAMTMDETIFVDESFDLSNPEDQALYAHERHHQLTSGGAGADGLRDGEELAARAIERMVLHRSKAGEDFHQVLRDANDLRADGSELEQRANQSVASEQGDEGEPEDEAQSAVQALIDSGKPYGEVVHELARFVIAEMGNAEESQRTRSSPGRSI